jgi:hypothetical protein
VPLDLARAHASGVERDHLVVEIRQPALVFADQDGIETGFAVAGNDDIDMPVTGQNALAAAAVAMVLTLVRGTVLGQMVVEFGRHQPVQQGFLQFAQQAVLTHHRGRVLAG